MFIVSCPASNPTLPFTPFPTLLADGASCTCEEPDCGAPSDYLRKRWNWHWRHGQGTCSPPMAGSSVTFTAAKKIPAGSYVTFVSGLTVTSVMGTVKGMLCFHCCRRKDLHAKNNQVKKSAPQCQLVSAVSPMSSSPSPMSKLLSPTHKSCSARQCSRSSRQRRCSTIPYFSEMVLCAAMCAGAESSARLQVG